MVAALLSLPILWACSREPGETAAPVGELGEVVISLSQDPRTVTVGTRADGDAETLPPVDSFWVEIYNSSALRLYRKKYDEAKDEVIKLNAGEFRMVASHGDTLGAGFGKAYYLAETPFTVHGFVDNGRQPDRVEAVAKLANVKLAVNFGENLQKYYSNYYAVVRHSALTKKSVRFSRSETRSGYIPGGSLYLEVFAQLAGTGMQDGGVNKEVYFKTEPVEYSPNDFVTYNVDCTERQGFLDVNILVDNEIELVEQNVDVPTSALPQDAPFFTFRGVKGNTFNYGFPVGVGAKTADATVTFGTYSGIAEATLTIDNAYLTGTLGLPSSVNLLEAAPTVTDRLAAAGITWYARLEGLSGFVNVSGVIPALSINSGYVASNPKCAAFTINLKDIHGKESTAVLNLNGEPISATVHAADYDIWGWKVVSPYAVFPDVNNVDPSADVKLQYSLDGTSWSTVDHKSISGKTVYFNDATGLTAGKEYLFRVMAGSNPDNVSAASTIKTEDPEQVPNSGFSEYTEQATSVPTAEVLGYVISSFTITWWQLYSDSGAKVWAVNSPVSIREGATVAYQDYKSYPTVAVSQDGAYDGTYVQIATVAEDNLASEILYGSYHVGELFLGKANNQVYGNWAKTSEGMSFSNRPASLRFMYKFNCNNSKPFYVHAEILDSEGNRIGEATSNNQTSSVGSWTALTLPISYSVTNRKAGGIRLSFMSCRSAVDNNHRSVTVKTLSGEHKIHAGNILYLDNVEMLYQ